MNRWLTLFLLGSATFAFATPQASEAEQIVQKGLMRPFLAKKRHWSLFSRTRVPANSWRLRMVDEEPRTDAAGKAFVSFAIDERHGLAQGENDGWEKESQLGCVYPKTGEIYVLRSDRYYPASLLLGKSAQPVEGVCQSEEQPVASAR